MPTIRAALLLAAAGACATTTFAQPVWRCGDSYSDRPCADGRPLAGAPANTAAERSQAAAAAARDARLADSLEKDRLRQEAQAPQAAQAVLQAPRTEPPEKHKWPEQAATRKLDVFTATAPGSRPPKGKGKGKKNGKNDATKDAAGAKAPKPPGLAPAAPARP